MKHYDTQRVQQNLSSKADGRAEIIGMCHLKRKWEIK